LRIKKKEGVRAKGEKAATKKDSRGRLEKEVIGPGVRSGGFSSR